MIIVKNILYRQNNYNNKMNNYNNNVKNYKKKMKLLKINKITIKNLQKKQNNIIKNK